jgi:hypothetical protein
MADLGEDKAAYLLGLVATVLGWQVTKITDDVRSTRSIAYWVETEPKANRTHVLIENVSKDKSVANVTFSMVCIKDPNCIKYGTTDVTVLPPTTSEVEPDEQGEIPENADELSPEERDKIKVNELIVKTTIAAGGSFGFSFVTRPKMAQPEFFFVPERENPIDIYIFKGGSLRGYVVRYYFEIMAAAFFGTALLLMAILIQMFNTKRKTANRRVSSIHSRTRK